MKQLQKVLFALLTLAFMAPALAEDYVIDTKGQHAFIQFKIKHLGYSWLLGGFNSFSGDFSYDEAQPEKNSINVVIQSNSIDSNHAKRDKHLRSDDFFDVEKYPEIRFVSSAYKDKGNGEAEITGQLTLHGITKDIRIDVVQIGSGDDPWKNFRRGFEGKTTLHLSDYNFKKGAMLGPVAENIELYFSFEGIRQ